MHKTQTRGFELLAIDRDGNSFGEIVERSQKFGEYLLSLSALLHCLLLF
ncbi:MAG: hypothetical protein Ct9H300mP21_02290 [Pseudomonadota bacterium]|nr:MAG: hypothetical protein Ct9H300mP21_02290 [Pseudomonadota bacterium]